MLIARRHARELSGLGDAERRAYLDEMCLLARAIEEAFQPLKLNSAIGAGTPTFTPIMPAWISRTNFRADDPLEVKIDAPFPYAT